MTNPTSQYEYRVTFTIPLSGTDRQQSVLKAKIAPLIDEMEKQIVALEMKPTIADTTVRLKVKSEPDAKPEAERRPIVTPQSLAPDRADRHHASGLTAAEGAHYTKAQRAAE